MAREFWEVFFPEDIRIFSVRYDSGKGEASIIFQYPDSGVRFKARFARFYTDPKTWCLDSIEQV